MRLNEPDRAWVRFRRSIGKVRDGQMIQSGAAVSLPLMDFRFSGRCGSLVAMTPEDISKLIVSVSMKDRAAFDLLYRQTSAKLFGVCLRVLNDRAEAEEALQEVFVKIWTKADRFAVSELSPISWLVAIARNHAIDRIRARRPPAMNVETALDIADPAPDPEASAVAGAENERVYRCLEELEPARAAAVRG